MNASLARHVLALKFSTDDEARINELAIRNQQGGLTTEELDELRGYANAGCLLGVLHAKARKALGKAAKK